MKPDLTLEQIKREPEKWEVCTLSPSSTDGGTAHWPTEGPWRVFTTYGNNLVAAQGSIAEYAGSTWNFLRGLALGSRPAGTTQPFRKVRE